MGAKKLREQHAALLYEEARMHVVYGRREQLPSGGEAAKYWDRLLDEIRSLECVLALKGIEPTP